ncbi:8259_t:CDS:2, partial [Scutellospora calospora]
LWSIFPTAKIIASICKRLEDLYCQKQILQIGNKIKLYNKYMDESLEAFKNKHLDVNLYVIKVADIFNTPELLESLGITVTDVGCIPDDGFVGKNRFAMIWKNSYFMFFKTKIMRRFSN